MGRVHHGGEATAVARARDAMLVYAVVSAACAALIWWARDSFSARYVASSGEVEDVVNFAIAAYVVSVAVHLLFALGLHRVSTTAWWLAVLFDVLGVVGMGRTLAEDLNLVLVAFFVLQCWVASRLLDPDVVRALWRFRRAAPTPPVEEEWRPPMVASFAEPEPPPPPPPPLPEPSRPATATFDYYG